MAQNIFIHEEISYQDGGSDNDDDDDSDFQKLNAQIDGVKKGYHITLQESTASRLYEIAGTEESEVNNEMSVVPKPHTLSTLEEQLILETKSELGI